MLELNDVLIRGEKNTLSLMAREGQLTCLTTVFAAAESSVLSLTRWLHAMLGLEPVITGYISIDGEPVTAASAPLLRRQMAFAPAGLHSVGEVVVYEPPTVQDVFALKANRQLPITNGILSEEMKRTGTTGIKAQLLAVAVLLNRPILLVDRPAVASLGYLRQLAEKGRTIIVSSADDAIVSAADQVVMV
ncbi:MAG: hypothetical protein IJ570_09030 [Prevotella sp.]|nr:hypothetical protein [Prevotella sp.]